MKYALVYKRNKGQWSTRDRLASEIKEVPGDKTPVGFIVWSPEEKWHKMIFEHCDDPFVELVKDRFEYWIEKGLPAWHIDADYKQYHSKPGEVYPYQDEWWEHVAKLLAHEIRLTLLQ